jgi:hypothetical protein
MLPPIIGVVLRSSLFQGAILGLAFGGAVWLGVAHLEQRGVKKCEEAHKVELAGSIIRAGEEARKIALEDAAVSAGFEDTRVRIQYVYRNREVEVVKHVPPDCVLCRLNPVGLGLLNDSLTNHDRTAEADDTSKPDKPVPRPNPGTKWNLPGVGTEADRGKRQIL